MIGELVSGDLEAYRHLAASSATFLPAERLAEQLASAGFLKVAHRRLMFGTIAIHWGKKDQPAG